METLKRRAEFDRVRDGHKWVAKGFILQGKPRNDDGADSQPRFGFAVGGKALAELVPGKPVKKAGAVLRNRARRRLKEAVRLTAPQQAQPNFDYVVIGRREALNQRFADLLEDFQFAFGKVNRPQRAANDCISGKRPKASGERAQRQVEHSKRSALPSPAQGDLE